MAVEDDDALDDCVKPPPPERKFIVWAGVLFATNVICALMLAARSASPVDMHGFFDVATFACLIGVAAFAVIRLMFLYPFRLLDLMLIVVVLSAGMKGAIEAVRAYAGPNANLPGNSIYILYAESCMVAACVLMGGAVLGLRHCRLLEIETLLKRSATIVFGMMSLPSLAGLVLIPLILLKQLMTEKNTSAESLAWIGALIFSFAATLTNGWMALKTIALTGQNVTQESKWREK